jgi:peptide/nickel transport system permease protein
MTEPKAGALAALGEPAGMTQPTQDSAGAVARRSRWPGFSVAVATIMLIVVTLLIVVVPFLPHYNTETQNLAATQLPPFHSMLHPLGTDSLGRDVLSRLSLAGRVSLLIAVAVVAINMVIGVVLGLLAGYFGGILDYLIMGLADIQLTIPVLLLLIAIIAAVGPSVTVLVVTLGVTFWVRYGRVARVMAASMRQRDFVSASVSFGASDLRILARHMLPTLVPELIVLGTFDIGVIITLEASLSYLGLGVQPPTPSWGGMIADGQQFLQTNPMLCIIPAAAVFLLVGGIAILSQHFTARLGRLDGATLRSNVK